jgi:hypothetical protein
MAFYPSPATEEVAMITKEELMELLAFSRRGLGRLSDQGGKRKIPHRTLAEGTLFQLIGFLPASPPKKYRKPVWDLGILLGRE